MWVSHTALELDLLSLHLDLACEELQQSSLLTTRRRDLHVAGLQVDRDHMSEQTDTREMGEDSTHQISLNMEMSILEQEQRLGMRPGILERETDTLE